MPPLTNPRQTVLVTVREEMDIMGKAIQKDNIITIAWHMPVSVEPELYAIAIGKGKFSAKMIQKSRSFVINFISKDLKEQALFCGRNHGEHIDKFEGSGLTKEESDLIDCPRIKEVLGYMECELIQEIDAGDHIIFLGKSLKSELKNNDKRLFHIGGNDFTTTID